MAERGFKFNELWMIESLKKDEQKTGSALYNDVWKPYTSQHTNLTCKYRDCTTKGEVIKTLEEIALSAQNGYYPLLHIECHGDNNKKGLILADNSLITWEELAPLIQKINVECGVNLCVVLAACYGKEGIEIFGHAGFNRAPLYALIGSIDALLPTELEQAFKLFYKEFIQTCDFINSLIEANSEIRTSDNKIQILNVEDLYQWTVVNSVYKGKERQKHKEYIVSEIMKNPDIRERGVAYARQLYKKYNNFDELQEKVKETYFCYDLHPSNRTRFE